MITDDRKRTAGMEGISQQGQCLFQTSELLVHLDPDCLEDSSEVVRA